MTTSNVHFGLRMVNVVEIECGCSETVGEAVINVEVGNRIRPVSLSSYPHLYLFLSTLRPYSNLVFQMCRVLVLVFSSALA